LILPSLRSNIAESALTAFGKWPEITRTCISKSPFVRLLGIAVLPTCWTSASGRRALIISFYAKKDFSAFTKSKLLFTKLTFSILLSRQ